jgi:FimV-like protein
MISLIIKSYLTVLLSIGAGSIFLLILGIYLIYHVFYPTTIKNKGPLYPFQETEEELSDLSEIAGDDVMATQLDLARAYIETNKKPLAKTLLEQIVTQGSLAHQKEAQRLLNSI